MNFENLGIDGAFVFSPMQHEDSRGVFQESFRHSLLSTSSGVDFSIKQVNQSTSLKGVIRGIHYSRSKAGQSKYVSCLRGRIWDVVVDLRTQSPTFGKWYGTELSAANGKAVFIEKGLGHGFLSLEDNSTVSYLCSEEYAPEGEGEIYPFDLDLAIAFQDVADANGINGLILSEKDKSAQSFRSARDGGFLPSFRHSKNS